MLEDVIGFNSPLPVVAVVTEAFGAIAQWAKFSVVNKKELNVRVSNLIAHYALVDP
jgi:hypothetical protein